MPFVITRNYRVALTHSVVLVYPDLYGPALPPAAQQALRTFPQSGGTLIATGAVGAGLDGVFGIGRVQASRAESHLRFGANALAPRGPGFRTLQISAAATTENALGVYRYRQLRAPALANYGDGTAAIVLRRYRSRGAACAIGLDLGFFFLKGYGNHAQGANLPRQSF